NLVSDRARESLRISEKKIEDSTRRLSSGRRINSADDDAAGLAISTRMLVKEDGLRTASDALSEGKDMLRTADGAYSAISGELNRINQLALSGANGTRTEEDRELMETEITGLVDEIKHLSTSTHYNQLTLLDEKTPDNLAIQASDQGGD